jgi:hypothetical protein
LCGKEKRVDDVEPVDGFDEKSRQKGPAEPAGLRDWLGLVGAGLNGERGQRAKAFNSII